MINGIKRKTVICAVIIIIALFLLYLLGSLCDVERICVENALSKEYDDRTRTVFLLNVNKPEAENNYYLNLKTRGCSVKVMVDEEVIYEYGEALAEEGRLIGKVFSVILIPETAYGGRLTIETKISDSTGSGDIEVAELCTTEDQQHYFVTNKTLGGLVGPVFLAIAIMLIVCSLCLGLNNRVGIRTFLLGLIILCMTGEILDTGGHYLMFISKQYIWNNIFQIDSLFMPAVSILFYSVLEKEPVPKRIGFVGAALNFIIMTAAIAGAVAIEGHNLSDYRFLVSVQFVIDAVVVGSGIFWLVKRRNYSRQFVAVFGGLCLWFVEALILSWMPQQIFRIMGTPVDIETVCALIVLMALGYVFVSMIKEETEQRKQQEVLNAQLQSELASMKMQNFSSQMQPHFLYNALSSIRQIIYEDPGYAARLIADFTIHLRGTIRAVSNDLPVPFSEEIKNIKAYVNIEQARFGERLTVDYDIKADGFEIIPLSIQPLVENAIRHGIYHRGVVGGRVTLKSEETQDCWIVKVIDTGTGFDVNKVIGQIDAGEKDSVGLKNLIFRLENLMNAKIRIESVINEGTTVSIDIPKEGDKK